MKFLCPWFQLQNCVKRVNSPLSPHTLFFFWVTLAVFYLRHEIVGDVLWGSKEMEILEEDQRAKRDRAGGVGGIHLCGNMKAELTRQ